MLVVSEEFSIGVGVFRQVLTGSLASFDQYLCLALVFSDQFRLVSF